MQEKLCSQQGSYIFRLMRLCLFHHESFLPFVTLRLQNTSSIMSDATGKQIFKIALYDDSDDPKHFTIKILFCRTWSRSQTRQTFSKF